jgi:hypothetical protein
VDGVGGGGVTGDRGGGVDGAVDVAEADGAIRIAGGGVDDEYRERIKGCIPVILMKPL